MRVRVFHALLLASLACGGSGAATAIEPGDASSGCAHVAKAGWVTSVSRCDFPDAICFVATTPSTSSGLSISCVRR